jgi:hypothetical protein
MTQSTLFSLVTEDPIVQPIYAGDSVWGCDWGSGYFHVWRDGNYIKLLPQDFASLRFAAAGDVVVIENAHMQPKKKSLAQVFEHHNWCKSNKLRSKRVSASAFGFIARRLNGARH